MATGFRRLGNGNGAQAIRSAVASLFGAASGDGQAVNDEIQTLKANLDTFMSTNATLLKRYRTTS